MDGLTIAASLTEIRDAAIGGHVQAIHQPEDALFSLRVSGARHARILVDLRRASIQLTQRDLANPPQPSPFTMLLRKYLRGGRIARIRQSDLDRVVWIDVSRRAAQGEEIVSLVAELLGIHGNLLLLRKGHVLGSLRSDRRNRMGAPYVEIEGQPKTQPGNVPASVAEEILASADPARWLVQRVDGLGRVTASDLLHRVTDAAGLTAAIAELHRISSAPQPTWLSDEGRAVFYPLPGSGERLDSLHEGLDRQAASPGRQAQTDPQWRQDRTRLQREVGRHARAVEKMRSWLVDADQADRIQHEADLLMIYLSEIPRGKASIEVLDPALAETVVISLEPSLSALENAQKRYERAKRMRKGRQRTETRLAHVRRLLVRAEAALAAHEQSRYEPRTQADVPKTAERLPAAEPQDTPKPDDGNAHGSPGGPRRCTVDGFTILVGKNARQNDDLVRQAVPDDVWMHARGHAGSHVVVKRAGSQEIPETVLRRAAGLAAFYSKAGNERRVEVTFTEARHLRKPKGAPPGLVIVSRESTLTVAPEGVKEDV